MSDALRYANDRLLDDQATFAAREDAIEDRLFFRKQGATYEAGTLVVYPPWCPEWFASAIDDIWRVASLKYDWDGEGSPRPRAEAVKTAVSLLLGLVHYELPTPFVCPLREGGVQIEWRQGRRELEVEFWDAEDFEYLKVFEDGSMEEGRCPTSSFRAFRRLVEWLDAGV